MKHTKGIMIVETKQGDLGTENPRCSIGIENGKILFHTTRVNAQANAIRVAECWNNYDTITAERDRLRKALKKYGNHTDDCGLSVIEKSSLPEIMEIGEQKFECPQVCDCGFEQAQSGKGE